MITIGWEWFAPARNVPSTKPLSKSQRILTGEGHVYLDARQVMERIKHFLPCDIGGAIWSQGWCIFLLNEEHVRTLESSKSQGRILSSSKQNPRSVTCFEPTLTSKIFNKKIKVMVSIIFYCHLYLGDLIIICFSNGLKPPTRNYGIRVMWGNPGYWWPPPWIPVTTRTTFLDIFMGI